jgi:hypothetical protein
MFKFQNIKNLISNIKLKGQKQRLKNKINKKMILFIEKNHKFFQTIKIKNLLKVKDLKNKK